MMSARSTPLDWPETNVVFFAFLLHLPWELFQLPLFRIGVELSAYATILHCAQAALGDVLIALAAFWGTALALRSRFWVLDISIGALVLYLGIGLLVTIVFELLATGPLALWQYAPSMPREPLLGIGLSPLLQWVFLPLLLLGIVRRQLRGAVTRRQFRTFDPSRRGS